MRPILIALALAAAVPMAACATHVPHVATNNPALERKTMAEVETAYRAAAEAYYAADAKAAWSPEERTRAYNALAAAWSGLVATRNAFAAENAPTFMDQAVAARKLAEEARTVVPS